MALADTSRSVLNLVNWTEFWRAICKADVLPVEVRESNRGALGQTWNGQLARLSGYLLDLGDDP